MAGQLRQTRARNSDIHSSGCIRRGFLNLQPAYSHAAHRVHTRVRVHLRPVPKVHHNREKFLSRAASRAQIHLHAAATEESVVDEIRGHDLLASEVAYLKQLVETLEKASTSQGKVSFYAILASRLLDVDHNLLYV